MSSRTWGVLERARKSLTLEMPAAEFCTDAGFMNPFVLIIGVLGIVCVEPGLPTPFEGINFFKTHI
jgi:hypothetical protein